MYNLGCSQYLKYDGGALYSIQDLQLLGFVDLFCEMDCWANAAQRAYLQKHLLMPTDNPEHQRLVSVLLQPCSTCHRIILAKLSS